MNTVAKISKPGQLPIWEYKGVKIYRVPSSIYGGAKYTFVTNGQRRYSTTLKGAEWDINLAIVEAKLS